MEVVETRDRDALEAFLRRRAGWHAYALADLDDFFFDAATWYAGVEAGDIQSVALLLDKLRVPILYAVAPPRDPATARLLGALEPALPELVFANLGQGLECALAPAYAFESHGDHWKMKLEEPERLGAVDLTGVEPLGPADLDELQRFYRAGAYAPGEREERFFEPYMLETGMYRALRRDGALASVAGVHVLSLARGVAALGNVATRPELRGRGLARSVTSAVSIELRARVELVALNVHVDNVAAIRCYERLGFRRIGRYVEGVLRRGSAERGCST